MSEVEASVARFAAMGTRVELHLFGRADPDALATARAAIEAVEDALTVRRESPAVALNRALAHEGEAVVEDPLLFEALLAVDAAWRATEGLFDLCVAGVAAPGDTRVGAHALLCPSARLRPGVSWKGRGGSLETLASCVPVCTGQSPAGGDARGDGRGPASDGSWANGILPQQWPAHLDPGLRRGDGKGETTSAAPPLPRWSALRIDRGTRRVAAVHPLTLDFGGFGKGYALDRAAAVLRAAGVTSAFLSAGESSIAVIGEHPLGGAWPLAIPHPEIDAVWLTELELTDASLSVSATIGAGATKPGRAAMVRPTDGAIITSRATAIAVAATGAEAEALSTALLVADAPALARLRAAAPDRRFLFSHGAPMRADRPMELTA